MADQTRSTGSNGGPDDPRAGGALLRLFAVQLLAVLGLTVVLTGAYALLKRGDDSTTAVANPTASAPATSAPATTPPASANPKSSPSAPPGTTASSPSPGDTADRPEIVVFNQDAPGGAGDAAAALLRDGGWTVFKVDDFRGNVSTTTVYYPEGLEQAARRAARELPGDVRTKVKFSNLSETRLTLILTDDYAG